MTKAGVQLAATLAGPFSYFQACLSARIVRSLCVADSPAQTADQTAGSGAEQEKA